MGIANVITVARMALIPVYLVFLIGFSPPRGVFAAIFFLLAALSDILDGYLARRRDEVTSFGRFLDPLADKLLVSTGFIALVGMGLVPAWVAMIVIARELLITGLRTMGWEAGIPFGASVLGKAKTVAQVSILTGYMLNLDYPGLFPPWLLVGVLLLAVVLTLASGVHYLWTLTPQIFQQPKG